jgi:hypothetical protein
VTADGEEYRFCEITVKVADPAAAWEALRDRCLPPSQPPIRDLAGYQVYLVAPPGRWWCQTAEDEIEYVGKVEPGTRYVRPSRPVHLTILAAPSGGIYGPSRAGLLGGGPASPIW